MSEFERQPESELREKAERWLDEVRSSLESSSDFPLLEPGDVDFLQQLARSLDLSERRVVMMARLLDYREDFFEKNGADIILEQYHVFRMEADKSMGPAEY